MSLWCARQAHVLNVINLKALLNNLHYKIPIIHSICNYIFNCTSLYQYYQGKLLIHLAIPFEEKTKDKLLGDYLQYYRLRKSLTTRQVAGAIGIVSATITLYERNQHPIPHDTAVLLANILEIDVSFIAAPYTDELKRIRSEMSLSQREAAEMTGLTSSYYSKLEEGTRRPSRKLYHQIMERIKSVNPQTSHSNDEPLQ